MEHLQSITLPSLIDMLAEQTEKFTRILTEGGEPGEKESCLQLIAALQKEIEFRKHVFDENITTTSQPPAFE